MNTDHRDELDELKRYKEKSWEEILKIQDIVKTLCGEVESLKSIVEKKDEEIKHLKKVLGVDDESTSTVYTRRARSQVIKLGNKRATWNEAKLDGHNRETKFCGDLTLSPRIQNQNPPVLENNNNIIVQTVSQQSPELSLQPKQKDTPIPPNNTSSTSSEPHHDNSPNNITTSATPTTEQQINDSSIASISSISNESIISPEEIVATNDSITSADNDSFSNDTDNSTLIYSTPNDSIDSITSTIESTASVDSTPSADSIPITDSTPIANSNLTVDSTSPDSIPSTDSMPVADSTSTDSTPLPDSILTTEFIPSTNSTYTADSAPTADSTPPIDPQSSLPIADAIVQQDGIVGSPEPKKEESESPHNQIISVSDSDINEQTTAENSVAQDNTNNTSDLKDQSDNSCAQPPYPTIPRDQTPPTTPTIVRRMPALVPPTLHIPSISYASSVSTPTTPSFPPAPPNTPSSPSTPSVHLSMIFRPKLPARMAAELVSKQGTLKRTDPALKKIPSENLQGIWSPPEVMSRSPSESAVKYMTNLLIPALSITESDSGSDSNLKASMSPPTDGLYSPDSSDSEDSMINIRQKFKTDLPPEKLLNYDSQRVVLAQKLIRGWIQRKRLAKIKKRTEAMKELLNTELGYAKSLELLIHHYVKPLRINSTSPNAFVLPSEVDDDIRQASAMMLFDLDALMKSWNYFSCVGTVMLSHVEQLHSHMPFIVNYERSQQILAGCTKNKEFSSFLKRRMISAELDYKTLDDFLILPVQRIPRLLEAIYKYTPVNHPDRDTLRKASHQMRLFAEKINRRKAAKAKLIEFLSCLKGFDGDFYQESRFLIREGNLFNDKKRPRYGVLLNDLVIICKPPKPTRRDTPVKKLYKYVTHMKLDSTTNLQVRPVVSNSPNPFSVSSNTNNSVGTAYIITLKNATMNITITTLQEDGKGWSKDVHSVLETLRKK